MDTEKTANGAGELSPAPDGSALLRFIAETERAHFRTVHDHGANPHAMMFWNMLRKHAGLSELTLDDLPAWCPVCASYHVKPHVQNAYSATSRITQGPK